MSPLPVFFKGLTPELMKRAEVELNEIPHVKAKAMIEFRRLIDEQKDIYCRLDDEFLLRFLRVKKFDTRKALKVLRNYYNFQRKHSGVITHIKPSEVRKVIEMNNIFYSPYRLEDGSHVAILRFGQYNPRIATAEELVATIFICAEIAGDCEATHIGGGNLILDLKDATFQQYKMFFTFPFAKFLLNALQECWPERLRGIHFVHQPYAAYAVFQVAKHLGKKKLMERIHFHGSNLSGLHEHIPRDFLPEEFEGTLGPISKNEFASFFLSQESYIEKINKYGILEKTK